MFGPSNSYTPAAPAAHPSFSRLRRDVTADATVLAVVYRILHMHCSEMKRTDIVSGIGTGLKMLYSRVGNSIELRPVCYLNPKKSDQELISDYRH